MPERQDIPSQKDKVLFYKERISPENFAAAIKRIREPNQRAMAKAYYLDLGAKMSKEQEIILHEHVCPNLSEVEFWSLFYQTRLSLERILEETFK